MDTLPNGSEREVSENGGGSVFEDNSSGRTFRVKKKDLKRLPRQAERILAIMGSLQSQWYSLDELCAQHPKFTKRTIYRDLEVIRSFFTDGLQSNSRGQMHLIPSKVFFVQPLDLTNVEAISLYFLCQLAQNYRSPISYLDPVQTAFQKLRSLSQALYVQTQNDDHLEYIHLEMAPISPQANRSVFSELLLAHEKRNAVNIEYDSICEGEVIGTRLEPYHLHFTRRAWYVTGKSGFHHGVRTFHLERIRSLKVIPDSTFVIPIGWSYENYRGNAWNMIRGSEDLEVILLFSPLVARNVASVRWHKNQLTERQADGTLLFRVHVSGISEIIWWILGYGDQVEVLSPPFLRQAVRDKIRAMSMIYEKDGE